MEEGTYEILNSRDDSEFKKLSVEMKELEEKELAE